MSLLVRIVEILLIITVVRTFITVVSPPAQRRKTSPRHPDKPERFEGDHCDISDADYEEIR